MLRRDRDRLRGPIDHVACGWGPRRPHLGTGSVSGSGLRVRREGSMMETGPRGGSRYPLHDETGLPRGRWSGPPHSGLDLRGPWLLLVHDSPAGFPRRIRADDTMVLYHADQSGRGCYVYRRGHRNQGVRGSFRQDDDRARCRMPLALVHPDKRIRWRIVRRRATKGASRNALRTTAGTDKHRQDGRPRSRSIIQRPNGTLTCGFGGHGWI